MDNEENRPIPVGKIKLLDGSVLDCYPPYRKGNLVDHEFLDVDSDEYKSQIKSDRLRNLWNAYNDEAIIQMFLDNAFLLLDSSNLVFADSRIFLTPLPIANKLFLKDDTDLQKPVLGALIEWWRNCHAADFMDSNGKEWIIYKMSGCPITGRNRCSLLNRKGETRQASVKSFNEAWKSFANINSRYKEAKNRFRAYSMRESLFILSERHRVNIDQHVDPLLYSECMHREIDNRLRQTFHKSDLHDR